MAEGQLTPRQITSLALAISAKDLVQIAEAYFEFSDAQIKNIKADEHGNSGAQSREIIRKWANKNPEDQVKKLATILYEAAKLYGSVDQNEVEKILKVPKPVTQTASARKKLTGEMKINLSKRITGDGDLNDLGIRGFDLEEFVVASAIRNNKGINEAAYAVINAWSEEYKDEGDAYDALYAILNNKLKKRAWLKVLE